LLILLKTSKGYFCPSLSSARKEKKINMKKQKSTSLAILALLSILMIAATPLAESYVRPWRFQLWPAVFVNAHCNITDADITIKIGIDSSMGFKTPYTFSFPSGTHTITVPRVDQDGHPFVKWNTGEETPTITVSSSSIRIAYYGVDPPPLPYDVVIDTSFNGEGNVNVNITMDGEPTGFETPHTFTELTGIHTFTVPTADPTGHRFDHWIESSGSLIHSNTITVSNGGVYTAYYDVGLCIYVTPSDPKVMAVANGKSWMEMLNYVSSEISYGDNTNWQMPNETLSLGSGQCRDYATLYVSMLRAQGYTAYVVLGCRNNSGTVEGHAWVVLNLNETYFHIEPQVNTENQNYVNFTNYQPDYYFDEGNVLSPVTSKNPPVSSSGIENNLVFSTIVLTTAVFAIGLSIFMVRRKKQSDHSTKE
jgi:transglutaminase-like putative cysteine protease